MNRRDFLQSAALAGLAALVPSGVRAMGQDTHFTIAKLNYAADGWDPRPSAIRRLLLEVEKRTSIAVDTDVPTVAGDTAELFDYPFTTLSGESRFGPLSDAVISNVRTYLKAGGFLLVDSAEGVRSGPFTTSTERMFGRLFPDKKLATIPDDHVLYKSFYLIDKPLGRVNVVPQMRGIFDEDRLLAVVCPNDLLGAWARDNFGQWQYAVSPGGKRQREMAFRLGINLVMYALCINYKADQVHVPFILKRRQWKVD